MTHKNINVNYDIIPCDLGYLFVGATDSGLCTVMILQDPSHYQQEFSNLMNSQFKNLKLLPKLSKNPQAVKPYTDGILSYLKTGQTPKLTMDIYGTDFQKSVWQALLKIPHGETVTYSDIADTIKNPTAVRATGTAIGRNPISIIIPCHRVVNKSGGKMNYLWGADVKKSLQALEANHQ